MFVVVPLLFNFVFRNVLNKHGDIIQVRLQVAKQLQTFPAGPIKQGLIRECLEKAVEINPFHPEANYRLAMLYSSMVRAINLKTSKVLCHRLSWPCVHSLDLQLNHVSRMSFLILFAETNWEWNRFSFETFKSVNCS